MNYFLGVIWFLSSLTYSKNDIEGIWLSADKEVKFQIYQHEQKYFGKIIWYKSGKSMGKYPCKKTENIAKLVGVEVLKNFQFDENVQKWKNGTIYHPQLCKEFKGLMWLEKPDVLKVRGYWGAIYKTDFWTRVKE